MKRRWFLGIGTTTVGSIAALALPAAAQPVRPRPPVVTVTLGFAPSNAQLWALPAEMIVDSLHTDTMLVRKVLRGWFAIGGQVTLFPARYLGLTAAIHYVGMPTLTSCAVVGHYAPDSEHFNETACGAMDQSRRPSGVLSLQGGAMVRLPNEGTSPFVGVSGGMGLRHGQFVTTSEFVSTANADGLFYMVEAESHSMIALTGTVAVGAVFGNGSGVRPRLEARRQFTSLPVPTRSPNALDPLRRVPVRTAMRGTTILSFSIEIDVARTHRRRY